MKGDFTRVAFRPEQHYSSVRLQQGRVLVDADWNEQVDLQAHRDETATADLAGRCAAPMHAAGFAIQPQGATFQIGAGRYYVDGILCENEQAAAFTAQPDLPGAALPGQAGTYLAYLDVWQRHLTAVERPELREVALGGPDTATRTRTIWQVKLLRPGDVNAAVSCDQFGAGWSPPGTQSTGRLRARAEPEETPAGECLVPPGAGFRGLENKLYRVEIVTPGPAGTATFVWSRDNGTMLARLENIQGSVLNVSDPGKDAVSGFAAGQWVELSDEGRVLRGEPGVLVELASVQGNELTVRAWPDNTPLTMASFGAVPTVRRWDSAGALPVQTGQWIELEDGVQVEFAAGEYRTGDYWLIPARTLTGDVEWPRDSSGPVFQPRHGIVHHYCALALLRFDGTNWTLVSDCRDLFPPLTEITSFFYLGGDGQEAMPDPAQPQARIPLAQPLRVGVANGEWPVQGAAVRFRVVSGNGRLQGGVTALDVLTGADGTASCTWEVDATTQSQQVEAALVNGRHLPVRFSASLSRASAVAYDPAKCPDLAQAGARTVQDAIDRLCQMGGREPGMRITDVVLPRVGPLRNDSTLLVQALAEGIVLRCDAPVQPDMVSRPTCFVTIELPVSAESQDFARWGAPEVAFQALVLAALVAAKERDILWVPSRPALDWLQKILPALLPRLQDRRILARLTLKGNFIAALDREDLYLDGDAFGLRRSGAQTTDLRLPSGDGRRGGDFEMWFWLIAQSPLAGLNFDPATVAIGGRTRGVVTLSSPAQPGAAAVTLAASNPAAVKLPQSVTVPAGQTSQTFDVSVDPQASPGQVIITATFQGASLSATLTLVRPPG